MMLMYNGFSDTPNLREQTNVDKHIKAININLTLRSQGTPNAHDKKPVSYLSSP